MKGSDALVAHGEVGAVRAAGFLAHQQLAGGAEAQVVEQVLAVRLADLIAGAQRVGVQQGIAVGEQRAACVPGQVQALQFGQVGGLRTTAQTGGRLAGANRATQQAAGQQQGRH